MAEKQTLVEDGMKTVYTWYRCGQCLMLFHTLESVTAHLSICLETQPTEKQNFPEIEERMNVKKDTENYPDKEVVHVKKEEEEASESDVQFPILKEEGSDDDKDSEGDHSYAERHINLKGCSGVQTDPLTVPVTSGPVYCVSWLQERYEEKLDERECSLRSMYLRYKKAGGDLNRHTFSRYVRRVFSHVRSSVKRLHGVKDVVFSLKQRTSVNDVIVDNPYDISQISDWVPSSFFVCKKDTEEIHLASFGEIVNGNPTVNKIVFKRNRVWEFHVGIKQIILEDLLISPHYSCTKASVQNICDIISKLKPCKGREQENSVSDQTKIGNYTEELWGPDCVKIYRAKHCKKVLPFISITSSCRTCQNNIKFISSSDIVSKESTGETDSEEEDSSSDDEDMRKTIRRIFPEASDEMLALLVNQQKNLERHPNGRRWDKNIISLCLSIWRRSPKNYKELRDSKVLILPTPKVLHRHKNCVDQ